MLIPSALSFDLLRAYSVACKTGSLSRAAHQLNRSQSSLSMQIGRLEGLLGCILLRRTGRGVLPTQEGELLLGYAERLLALGDEAASRLSSPALDGSIRIGMPEEVAVATLPSALGRFRGAHPGVALEVTVDNTAALEPLWSAGSLDVMIGMPSGVRGEAEKTWNAELRWVCGMGYEASNDRPLDVVVFSEPCVWRRRVLQIMAASDHSWRIAFVSPSVSAVQAAVDSGLGISLLTEECIRHRTMRQVPNWLALPPRVVVQYGLYVREGVSPAVRAAAEALSAAVNARKAPALPDLPLAS